MGYHKSLAGVGWISTVPSDVNPTPLVLATVSSLSLDVKEEDSDLQGDNIDILDSFPTKRVISGKIQTNDFSASLLAMVTNGVTVTSGRPSGYIHTGVVPATPFQVTVPLTNPVRTFTRDLGVINLSDGKAMTRGATSTGSNVYAVNESTGQYTFNTADAGDSFLIYHDATPTTADGVSAVMSAVTSALAAPKFGIHVRKTLAGKSWGVYIPAARIPGLSGSFKREGWSDTSLEWKATTDATGKIIYLYSPE